ncbi:MAG: thymidine kinase [Gammaproteobacteria bacterium]|nr:thymidine kinase [Gammaproteobacteria bacterium]MDP6166461.1 thymidine kinase [Gammaproteobacteria bacterium]
MAQLYFYYSSMNAGKSTSLLQSAYNYQEMGMHAFLMTAALDDRYGVGAITSRIGLSERADLFSNSTDLLHHIRNKHTSSNIDCVLIDESQFLTRQQVLQLTRVVDDLNIPVLCYGIRSDFQGELFTGSQYLLTWADKLIELKTVCWCGRKATMVVRKNTEGQVITQGEQVHIGGNDTYQSLCRKHFAKHHWQAE